jgi:hypothetical protein
MQYRDPSNKDMEQSCHDNQAKRELRIASRYSRYNDKIKDESIAMFSTIRGFYW